MSQPSPYPPNYQPKPGAVTALTVMTLVNGILNIVWGVGLGATLAITIVGLVCIPLAIYPIVLGILEIVYAAKLLSTTPQPVQPARYLAIMEICGIALGNVISLIVGVLALVFYADPVVQNYFAGLGPRPTAMTPYQPVQ